MNRLCLCILLFAALCLPGCAGTKTDYTPNILRVLMDEGVRELNQKPTFLDLNSMRALIEGAL
jgi:hypothetical protein